MIDVGSCTRNCCEEGCVFFHSFSPWTMWHVKQKQTNNMASAQQNETERPSDVWKGNSAPIDLAAHLKVALYSAQADS
jgi:hypothetical protein